MKAAKQYKEQWEEANWLRLVYLANILNKAGYKLFKNTAIAINVLLYLNYQVLKGLVLIVKIMFLTEPQLNRIEKDETWIFRQIK